ncbi:Sporulation and spore germination [Streptoalloteichus tenebrarius]|uniref:Sporulation and spore germination n=1 Tax=Streptoalloteichus tenebrarius (strain ATCC 17920 / DSM 40477 / JCM 4838 / CBS 697.72 / NBRC 16177 / NCIMB 11028 / NRRL B-12390 / A12253. 1 / ISP 5477) TaxID=1933 RepID=A0ABT1HWA4_STRSD|nr:hypothetical protein [Streptoalloteichus tenebrarius]MCP2259800.1 Sporulation and spore germination [Streptoalloteichus tenebrarius]BFE99254.1 hypothetical protein GCM10020241_09300 [Streptoalloteichus tenebrarius]
MTRWPRHAVLVLLSLLVAGCGALGPTGVADGGDAPAGVATGAPLYFLDSAGALRASPRATGRLGDIRGAVELLMTGPSPIERDAGLRTEIPRQEVLRSVVYRRERDIVVILPFASRELPAKGADQVVCTALAVHLLSGGGVRDTHVILGFTDGESEPRSCPVLPG